MAFQSEDCDWNVRLSQLIGMKFTNQSEMDRFYLTGITFPVTVCPSVSQILTDSQPVKNQSDWNETVSHSRGFLLKKDLGTLNGRPFPRQQPGVGRPNNTKSAMMPEEGEPTSRGQRKVNRTPKDEQSSNKHDAIKKTEQAYVRLAFVDPVTLPNHDEIKEKYMAKCSTYTDDSEITDLEPISSMAHHKSPLVLAGVD
jgi:hypothetical protein